MTVDREGSVFLEDSFVATGAVLRVQSGGRIEVEAGGELDATAGTVSGAAPPPSQLFQALPVQVNTTTAMQSALSGVCAPLTAGVWKVTTSWGWSHDAGTTDFWLELLWDSAPLTTHGGGLMQKQEPKDAAGTNTSGTGTDQNHPASKVHYVTVAEGATPSVDVNWKSGTGGQEAAVWDLSVAVEWFSTV